MFLFVNLVACQKCDLTINPAGYVSNPCNCSTYYQCLQVPGSSIWNPVLRPCPPCLCFSSSSLTCSILANPLVPLTDPSCQVPTTSSGVTSKYQHWGQQIYNYIWSNNLNWANVKIFHFCPNWWWRLCRECCVQVQICCRSDQSLWAKKHVNCNKHGIPKFNYRIRLLNCNYR
jgi:hypothetical protein